MSGATNSLLRTTELRHFQRSNPGSSWPSRVTRTKLACQCKSARPSSAHSGQAKVRVTQQQKGTDHDNR